MRILVILFILICSSVTFAQTIVGTQLTEPLQTQSRIDQTPATDITKIKQEGFEALYNMDYATARVRFNRMTQLEPQKPAGYFYLATNYWLELLNSSRRLQTDIYSGDSFYAETKDKVDEQIDKEFRRLITVSLDRSETLVKLNPKDTEALYYQGAAHGLLASYEATVARAFISALRNGSKAVDIHKHLIEIAPTFWDAYLTVGTYEYIVGSLPFGFKALAALGGFHGSKVRGLGELNLVAQRGHYASDDAKVVLMAFYAREKRYDDMLSLLDKLSTRYPGNYLFKIERASTLVKLNRGQESIHIFDAMLKDKSSDKIADLVHFQYGEVLASQGFNPEALKHFQALTAMPTASKELVTRAYLRAGQLFDLLAQRDKAIAQYQLVLKRDNVFDSQQQAQKYLKHPYNLGS